LCSCLPFSFLSRFPFRVSRFFLREGSVLVVGFGLPTLEIHRPSLCFCQPSIESGRVHLLLSPVCYRPRRFLPQVRICLRLSQVTSFSEGFSACFLIFVFPRLCFFLHFSAADSAYVRFWFSTLNLTQPCWVEFFLRSHFSSVDSCPSSALLSPVRTSSHDFLASISLRRSAHFVSFSAASLPFSGRKPVPAACARFNSCPLLLFLLWVYLHLSKVHDFVRKSVLFSVLVVLLW
jgi:hypothetical protein